MAYLGAIGRYRMQLPPGMAAKDLNGQPTYAVQLRAMVMGGQASLRLAIGGKDTSEGSPAQPSLRLDNWGCHRFRWLLHAGANHLSVSVKQAINLSPRPSVKVRANPAIGVNSDVTVSAGAGTGWVTITVDVTPSSAGLVWVEFWNNLLAQPYSRPAYWDHMQPT